MTRRQDLRAQAIEISGGFCEWPGCRRRGAELAHLHSIGMGGRPSADTLDNTAWMCPDHARISDGLHAGGPQMWRESHRALGLDPAGAAGLAYLRAEALSAHLARTRPL